VLAANCIIAGYKSPVMSEVISMYTSSSAIAERPRDAQVTSIRKT